MSALNRTKKVDLLTLCDDLCLVVPENSKFRDPFKIDIGNLRVMIKIFSKTIFKLLALRKPKAKY